MDKDAINDGEIKVIHLKDVKLEKKKRRDRYSLKNFSAAPLKFPGVITAGIVATNSENALICVQMEGAYNIYTYEELNDLGKSLNSSIRQAWDEELFDLTIYVTQLYD